MGVEMVVVEKKSKVKKRHQKAIAEYEKWLKENPTATKRKRMRMFDSFVDSAKLEQEIADN